MTDAAHGVPVQDGQSQGVLKVPEMASLYLQPLGPMGLVIPGAAATGFLVRDGSALYLVTNRHVVTARNSKAGDRLRGFSPSALRVFLRSQLVGRWVGVVVELGDQEERPLWWEHPEHGKQVDVVAIPFPAQHVPDELVDWSACYTVDGPSLARLAIASNVHVVGYPVGFDPNRASAWIGVWTHGTLAWPPSIDWEDLPTMLIDCRARGGQSGSPVVFYADESTSFLASDGSERTGPAWDLVGVYSGRTHQDSDIGMVWRRSAVAEIIAGRRRPDGPDVTPLDPGANRAAGLFPPDTDQHGGTALGSGS
nr:hypothetical protein KPHV_87670 [Kitasatospora purpeofusca]